MSARPENLKPLHVFLHIPKTSGSTIREYLKPHFKAEEIVFYYDRDIDCRPIVAIKNMLTSESRLVFGHFPFGLHQVIDRPVQYYTVLRPPVSRLISCYQFTRSRPDEETLRGQLIADAKNGSILEFCEKHPLVCNQQCAYLSPLRPTNVDVALQHLETMQFGLQEYTALFLRDMSQAFELGPVVFKNRKVRKKNTAVLPESVMQELHEKCHLDNQLYERAKAMFLARQMSSPLRLKLQNTLLQKTATLKYHLTHGK